MDFLAETIGDIVGTATRELWWIGGRRDERGSYGYFRWTDWTSM